MLVLSLILAFFVAMFVIIAQNMLTDVEYDKENKIQYITGNFTSHTLIVAVVIGAVNYFAAMAEGMLWITPILAIVITAAFGFLVFEWWRGGSSLKEMMPFLVLTFLFWLVADSVFCAMSALITSLKVARVIEALPTVLAVVTVALFFVSLFLFKEEIGDKKSYRYLAIVTAVLAVIGIGCLTTEALDVEVADVNNSAAYAKEADDSAYVESWEGIHFYNDEVREDDNRDNDYNFGPNPYVDGKDVNYYVEDFNARRSEDPALLSATALALDSAVNTDYIGEILYAGYDKKLTVLERADAATRVMTADKSIFDANNKAISNMLESAKSVELVKESKISDQLYMNGYTADEIPQVVIYESDVTSDWCLVYTFKIKTSEVKIAFRIPCGYQWTNPYEVLKAKSSSTKGGGKGGGDIPTPKPKPKYKKDPSKDPVNQGNAPIGGGKNKDTDGTGDKQSSKPDKDSGNNAGSGDSSSGGSGSNPSDGSGRTDPITKHDDSHDSGGSGGRK